MGRNEKNGSNFILARPGEVVQFRFRSVADAVYLGHGGKRFRLEFFDITRKE